ncbi:MAG: DUF2752 domain-containing protein [Prevotella sp.]|nr:DUF2752 domain-containing protein [Prevotella sp.]
MRTMMIVGFALLVVLGLVIYFVFDPTSSAYFPKCGFYVLTGYKCPGCGMQRMLHALLNGDIVGAFRYNAFLMVMFPLGFLLLLLELFRNRFHRLYMWLPVSGLGYGFLISVLLWWILRNVFGW